MALRRDVRKGFWYGGMGGPSDCEGTPSGANYVAGSRDRVELDASLVIVRTRLVPYYRWQLV